MKRRKRSAAARLRSMWLLLLMLVIAAGVAGYFAARWPALRPKHVVIIGNHAVSSRLIARRAAIDARKNLWLQDMHSAAARIAAIPQIGTVNIARSLPAGVTIRVTERVPFAAIRSGARRAIVDHDLRVLDAQFTAALPELATDVALPRPGAFILDRAVLRLRDDYDRLNAAHVIVAKLGYDRFNELVGTTPRNVALLLGDDDDLARKIRLIGPILSQIGTRKIAAIDLRAPGTPVVVYR